jgi:hypothetical protein
LRIKNTRHGQISNVVLNYAYGIPFNKERGKNGKGSTPASPASQYQGFQTFSQEPEIKKWNKSGTSDFKPSFQVRAYFF